MVVPEWLVDNALRWFGDAGREWVDGLPVVVERLAGEWELELGEAYEGGSHALVLRTTGADREPLVLKIPFVDDENRGEADVLRLYAGQGAVLLHKFDPVSGALLEERLVPGTALGEYPDRGVAVEIACELLARLRRPPNNGHAFSFTNSLASSMAEAMPGEYELLGHPFSVKLLERAVAIATQLAQERAGEYVVNRDAHLGNILAAEREPWLLIDPKPLVGDAAFDLSFLLIDLVRGGERSVSEISAHLSRGKDFDVQAMQNWAFLRAVESALWSLGVGGDAAPDLDVARLLSG